jgi:A/G-specific adenine glycosylase
MAKIASLCKKNFNFSLTLLSWYNKHGRALPWRCVAGRAETPYHTWLSEIMLQQTGVTTVIPYYQRFITRWPNVKALAKADEADILKEWAGLGYYSRARNLLKCARLVVDRYKGQFPDTIHELKKLNGIGNYTANAIIAIAFDKAANVVDGNVERVMARLFAVDLPSNSPSGKKHLTELAASILPSAQHGDYAQALMDLGATLCTPKNPSCGQCPWQTQCLAFKQGNPTNFPRKIAKAAIPTRYGFCTVQFNQKNQILLQQRPSNGLLGGLWEFYDASAWTSIKPKKKKGDFQITHIFSHFKLIMDVCIAQPDKSNKTLSGMWYPCEQLPAMSTLHRKILAEAQKHSIILSRV